MFCDWNGNGKKDDMFDDSIDWYIMNEENENNSNGKGGCCGGCCGGLFLLLLVTLPVWAPVALTLNAAGIIEIHDDENDVTAVFDKSFAPNPHNTPDKKVFKISL